MEQTDVSHRMKPSKACDLKGIRYGLTVSGIASLTGTVQLLLITLGNLDGLLWEKIVSYIIASLFWASVAVNLAAIAKTTAKRNACEKEGYKIREIRCAPIGVFSFFKNREAAVADIVLFASAIAVAVVAWIQVFSPVVVLSLIGLLFLSFNGHCILNGRNYRYYKILTKYQKQKEHE